MQIFGLNWKLVCMFMFFFEVKNTSSSGQCCHRWDCTTHTWSKFEKRKKPSKNTFDTTFATHAWPSMNQHQVEMGGHRHLESRTVKQRQMNQFTMSKIREREKKSFISNGISFEIVFFLNAVCDTTFCLVG